MKPTRSQLEALQESLEGLTVDDALAVKITGQADGRLLVRISDHWGYEYVKIDRQGLASRWTPENDRLDMATGQGRR